MLFYEGYITKSASDITKPFRTRYCTVSMEKISNSDQIRKKKKRTSFQLRQRSISLNNQPLNLLESSDPLQQRVVLTYYKKENKPHLGKFILDDCSIRNISEGIKGFPFAICVTLVYLNIPRDLYLCFEKEEEKENFLKVLQEHTQTQSNSDDDNFDKPTVKEIPIDLNNPIFEELDKLKNAIRSESSNQELDNLSKEYIFPENYRRDSGYSTTNSRSSNASTISRNSFISSLSPKISYDINSFDPSKTLLSCPSVEYDLSLSPLSSKDGSNLNMNLEFNENSEESKENFYENVNISTLSI
ncbi:uncharacterized protein LOC100200465 isoform X3 [Hydra vulgaris]|uniref:Uncharacterized protein LOC100200465 isoform X3 n=1 Tax=Hydra vulgaris TaxID=6087 RepID=A0ABM4C2E4_HYDVU